MNNLKLLLRAAGFAASLVFVGCVARVPADDVIVEPVPLPEQAGTSVSFEMSQEQFGRIAGWLGHNNTLTIEKPVNVTQEGTTLDAKAGTRFSYEMGENFGKFEFDRPYPTIKTNVLSRLIGGVALHEVLLNADGSGVASTGVGKFGIRWLPDDAESVAAKEELPIVYAYSTAGCPPCSAAKREFADAKDLPFRIEWLDKHPSWVAAYPTFHWEAAKGDWRQRAQYDGVDKFTAMWRLSREGKKQAVRYHAGHDCPSCGTLQYVKESDQGARHTHRCSRCQTAWQHDD